MGIIKISLKMKLRCIVGSSYELKNLPDILSSARVRHEPEGRVHVLARCENYLGDFSTSATTRLSHPSSTKAKNKLKSHENLPVTQPQIRTRVPPEQSQSKSLTTFVIFSVCLKTHRKALNVLVIFIMCFKIQGT